MRSRRSQSSQVVSRSERRMMPGANRRKTNEATPLYKHWLKALNPSPARRSEKKVPRRRRRRGRDKMGLSRQRPHSPCGRVRRVCVCVCVCGCKRVFAVAFIVALSMHCSRTQNPVKRTPRHSGRVGGCCGCCKRSPRAQSFLGRRDRAVRGPRRDRWHACSRGSGRPSSVRRPGNTSWRSRLVGGGAAINGRSR